MFCTNAVLDEVIVCLLGLKVVELLLNLAAQEVPANYETVMNLCCYSPTSATARWQRSQFAFSPPPSS
jgi:hypothetical protein